MNSSESVFVREFTLAILKTIKESKVSSEQISVVNSDLIPKFSEKFSGMSESINLQIPKEIPKLYEIKKPVENRVVLIPPKVPIKSIAARPFPVPRARIPLQPQQTPKNSFAVPAPSTFSPPKESYGKIDPLLRDASVSTIECSGAGQNIIIIRAGQKQFTKINLNPVEIKQILEKIAQEARIPLMEGIFKAAVDGFSVNAVVSSVIGSRFIIKKQTPYSLLEG